MLFSNPLLSGSLSSGLVIAMVTSLLFIILLRFLAGIMVWVMIALVILVIGYGKNSKERKVTLPAFFGRMSLISGLVMSFV